MRGCRTIRRYASRNQPFYHPGDHRRDVSGVPVDVVTIDQLLQDRGWPSVSLIKIDVQGAELRVIQGARRSLERFKPALFIELDETLLKTNGTSASEIIATLTQMGYKIFRLEKKSPPLAVTAQPIFVASCSLSH